METTIKSWPNLSLAWHDTLASLEDVKTMNLV